MSKNFKWLKKTTNLIEPKMCKENHWMSHYNFHYYGDNKSKISATAEQSFNIRPRWLPQQYKVLTLDQD